ncbi:MAG: 3-isopropylmalate dehydrogenase [Opitutaceae bacterium]|nr:3-isopropylmalate dehydrogenase [Opitutaceae bacterium]
MKAKIALTPGDGIGPEVVHEACRVLEAIAERFNHKFEFAEYLLGGCAIDKHGTAMPDATLQGCLASDAVLLGAVGGPKWDDPSAKVRPEQGLLAIRKQLGLYANLRPVTPYPQLARMSPLKPERVTGVDILVIRELTGGLYFGTPKGREKTPAGERAVDTLVYTDGEIRRIVRLAFQIAQKRRKLVTSVDKANVLESSRLWRQVAIEVGKDFPDVKLEHHLVDSCAMRLITHAPQFDVIVTENMFGDILTDEAAVLTGSLGMLPSASLGEGRRGLYEPIHGSAPDIAGKGIANPVGTILSVAMMLRYSFGLETEARAIERAVAQAIADGQLTVDLGTAKPLSTTQMGAAVRERLA